MSIVIDAQDYRPIDRKLWAAALTEIGDVRPHFPGNQADLTTDVPEANPPCSR